MHHAHNRQTCIEANEVSQFQRTHRVVRAKLKRVIDGLHRAHAFIQRINSFVDHRDQYAIDDECREIF